MDKFLQFLTKLTNGEIIELDKMLHFSFSFIVASFFMNPYYSVVAVLIVNILKELFDKYQKKTRFDIYDILAGVLGAGFYLLTQIL